MYCSKTPILGIALAVAALCSLIAVPAAFAHCDTMDGPVIEAARAAIETGNLNHALIWVPAEDEAEIRAAFENTLIVRKLTPQAQELADKYFFETLVRLHRAGEGEPYTGLKPAPEHPDPAIAAADSAIRSGEPELVAKLIDEVVHHSIQEAYERVRSERYLDENDVKSGRAYVSAYVAFIHLVERIHSAATASGNEHSGVELH